jgi:hypothetical protein
MGTASSLQYRSLSTWWNPASLFVQKATMRSEGLHISLLTEGLSQNRRSMSMLSQPITLVYRTLKFHGRLEELGVALTGPLEPDL